MGFGYILIGFLFLCNPIIHVVDLAPDCIGFFLICKGLNKLAYFNSNLSEAKDRFKKLGFTELIRTACILFIPYTSDSAMLLFAFIFGVVEMIYFIPALNYFFEGLNYIGMRYEGESVFAEKEKKKKFRTKAKQTIEQGTFLKNLTLKFYIFRIICTLLPELTSLQMYDNLGTVTAFSINYSRYKPFLYVVLGLIVLIFGIRWSVCVAKYFNGIRRDRRFLENLNKKYNSDIAVRTELFIGKNMKSALFLYICAVALSITLYIDGINILPGVLSSAALIAIGIMMGKYSRLSYAVLPFCIVRSALSIINLFLQKIYFIDNVYNEEAVEWLQEAAEQYSRIEYLAVIENVFTILSFAIFMIAFLKTVKKHLSESGIQDQNVQYSKANRDAEAYNAIGAKLLMNMILMLINFTLAAAYRFIMLELTAITAINVAVTVVWLLQTIGMTLTVNELLYDPLVNEEL